MSEQNEEKRPFKYYPTKFTLGLRLAVGAYLLYTSYKLLDGVQTGAGRAKIFIGLFMVLFLIIGLLLFSFSAYFLLKGRYEGGPADLNPKPEEGEANEESEAPAAIEASEDAPAEASDQNSDTE